MKVEKEYICPDCKKALRKWYKIYYEYYLCKNQDCKNIDEHHIVFFEKREGEK